MTSKKAKLRSPIVWFGGKGRMTAKILPLLPDHHIYVEAFGGGGSMLLAKKPSPVEVYNDLDSGLVNFFRVLRDPQRAQQLYQLACLSPTSREEYELYKDTWEQAGNDVARAYQWYYVAKLSFSGNFGSSWAFSVTGSSRGMAQSVSAWASAVERLLQTSQRLMRVQIEHVDFRRVINTYDTPATLFYLDPPYVPETRRAGGYAHELTAEDHAELVSMLLKLKGTAVLSGYAHELYAPLEKAGWTRNDFAVPCNAAARTRGTGLQGKGAMASQQRVESVWVSPNAQANSQAKSKSQSKASTFSNPPPLA